MQNVSTADARELVPRGRAFPVAGGAVASKAGVLAVAVALFLVAFVPRVVALSAYLTTDEGNWMGRAALFGQGLVRNDPMATYQSGHPGVTTMWTALAGMGLDRALGLAEYVRPDGLEKAPYYLETLRLARRGFPIITSLAVVAIGLLVWRLVGPFAGIIAAVLVGLQPFFLGHSVVAHLDGTLTSYMTVASLCAIVYWWGGGGRGYLVACGVVTALAFLTKAPASFLALFMPLIAVTTLLRRDRPAAQRVRVLSIDLAAWGGIIALVSLLLWPAFRTDPIWTLRSMIDYTEAVGGSEHENFFLGQPVGDPGPVYYLVTSGFRLTPVTIVGLAFLPLGLLLSARDRRRLMPLVVGLLGFILLFWAMMALPPKKFDRYMLPVFPSLEILAAIGYWLVLRKLAGRRSGAVLAASAVALGALQFLFAAQVYPYYLAYYNPMFGGGPAARKAFVVGWGEGLDVVANYLNQKPDAERLTLSGFYPRVLMAQFKGTVLPDKQYDPAQADYLVLYVNAVQRDLADRLRTVARGRRSEMVVRINGIEYARLVRVPPPTGRNAASTEFGGALRLERYYMKSEERRYLKSDDLHGGDTLELTLRWRLLQPVDGDYRLFLQMVDARGRVLSESDGIVGSIGGPTSTMFPEQETVGMYKLAVPEVEGEYWVAVGLQSPDGQRVPITRWPDRLSNDSRRLGDRVVLENIDVRTVRDTADEQ